jgi:hypothetical protein
LEEQVGGVLLEGDVADLVDDDQPVSAQSDDLFGQLAALVGVLEAGDLVNCGAEQDPVSGMGGFDAQADREVYFPVTGGSSRTTLRACSRKRPRRGDLVPFRGRLVVENEVIECLAGRERGGVDAQLRAGGIMGGLAVKDRGEVTLVGPARVSRLLCETGSGVADAGCFRGAGEELDLLDRVGAHQATSSPRSKSTPNGAS